MALPLVLLLDMDGTLIGNTHLQLCRHDLCATLKQRYDKRLIAQELKDGLIRPHLDVFLKSAKSRYPNLEIFVYTAAERKWATMLIKLIEREVGVRFNTPILAREQCYIEGGAMLKSLEKVAPIILKKLKSK